MGIVIAANSIHDLRPRVSEVRGAVDVRSAIVELITLCGEIRRPARMTRRIDDADSRKRRKVWRRDVFPALPTVAGNEHQTIVRPGPDSQTVPRRRRDGENGCVHLGPVHVMSDRTARFAEGDGIVASEVGTDACPRLTFVRGLPKVLRRCVNDFRIERREDDWKCPLPSLGKSARRFAGKEARIYLHVPYLPVAPIVSREKCTLTAGVNDVGVRWIRRDVAALTTADTIRPVALPVADTGKIVPSRARNAERPRVLLRSAYVVWKICRHRDVIDLSGGKVQGSPCRSTVHGYSSAAIVAFNHPLGVVGRNPQVMVVAVRRTQRRIEFRPGAVRSVQARVQHVNAIPVFWIRENASVVKRSLSKLSLLVGAHPCIAAIVGAKHTARVGFDYSVDALRIGT